MLRVSRVACLFDGDGGVGQEREVHLAPCRGGSNSYQSLCLPKVPPQSPLAGAAPQTRCSPQVRGWRPGQELGGQIQALTLSLTLALVLVVYTQVWLVQGHWWWTSQCCLLLYISHSNCSHQHPDMLPGGELVGGRPHSPNLLLDHCE